MAHANVKPEGGLSDLPAWLQAIAAFIALGISTFS
jgi:hypothetical protein